MNETGNDKSFGQRLQEIRIQQGYSIEELANITKIQQSFLYALENEHFDKLPGDVFAKGFIRSICNILKIDSSELLSLYQKALEKNNINAKNQNLFLYYKKNSNLHDKRTIAGLYILQKILYYLSNFKITFYNNVILSLKNIILVIKNPLVLRICLLGIFLILTLVVLFYLPVNIKFFQTSDTQNVVATKTQVPEDINLQKINNTDLTDSSHDNQELQKSQKLQIKALDKNDNAVKLEEAKNISIQNPSKIVANKQQVNTRQQLLTIKAKKPVKIKMMIDDKQWTFKDLEENNNYNFKFNKELHLMIYDASAVDVFFNDNYLGDLGEPGRIRRLTFMSQNPPLNLNEKTN